MTNTVDLLTNLNTSQRKCLSKNYANTMNGLRDLVFMEEYRSLECMCITLILRDIIYFFNTLFFISKDRDGYV